MISKTIKNEKDENVNSNRYDRLMVYSRYFARIPKYFNKAMKRIKIVNNFGESVQIVFPKLEKPLFYLGLFCIMQEVYDQYGKLNDASTKYKTLFIFDTCVWHLLASFLLPTIAISHSINYFVIFAQKYVKKKKVLQFLCVGFSVIWISALMTPIDNFSNFVLDNTLRKYLNYRFDISLE